MKNYYRDWRWILVFVLPGFLIYAFFELIPIGQTLYFSFHQWSGIFNQPLEFVGLGNYRALIGYGEFWQSMRNIAWYIVLSLVVQVPLGYALAIILSSEVRGFRFFKAAFFTPLVIALSAVGLMFYFILLPNTGALNQFLTAIGLEHLTRAWLADPRSALNALILVTAWVSYPFYLTIGFAAVTSIPSEVMEAAHIDGCGPLRRVFLITIPMVWESLKISVVLLVTGILKIFEIVFVMTQGGPNGLTQVPVSLMYYEAFRFNNYGRGSAVAVIVFALSLLAAGVSLRVMRREEVQL